MEYVPYGVFSNIIQFQNNMAKLYTIKSLKYFLGLIFIIGLSYNFYVANDLKYHAYGDASDYIAVGLSLAKTNNYGQVKLQKGEDLIDAFKEDKIANRKFEFSNYSTWRPPVWPFFIAGIFILIGYKLIYLIIFKFLLHLIGLYIFYKTLKLFNLNEIVTVIGVFLYGLSPAWQIYSRVFLSEPITLFLLTLWVFLLVSFLKKKSSFINQALVAGLLILCHPYYVFLPFTIWLIFLIQVQINFFTFLKSCLTCILIVFIWITRNTLVLDTNEIIITTSAGAVMAKGWNRDVPLKHTNTKGDLAEEGLVLKDYNYQKNKIDSEIKLMQLYKKATLSFIISNPDLVIPIINKKLLSAFNPFPETPRAGYLEIGRWLLQFISLLAICYMLIFPKNKIIFGLALGIITSTILITILTYSGFRFRMPQIGLELLIILFVLDDL